MTPRGRVVAALLLAVMGCTTFGPVDARTFIVSRRPLDVWVTRTDREFRDRAPHVVREETQDWWYFGDERAVACRVAALPGDRFDPTSGRRVARAW